MLATFTVNVDFDTSQVDEDDTVVTLREAVFRANQTIGPDEILFDPSLDGETILLTENELRITESVTIDAKLYPRAFTSFALAA